MLQIDDDKRREWLRALRRFKYGVRVRAKLGLLDTICQQIAAERKGSPKWEVPDWDHDRWITLLYTSIRDNQLSEQILTAFAKSAKVRFYDIYEPPTVADMLHAMDSICHNKSRELREKFGVFVWKV